MCCLTSVALLQSFTWWVWSQAQFYPYRLSPQHLQSSSFFWHLPRASPAPPLPPFYSYTSPWAIPPALYLNPALFPSPNATVGPPSDIYMKAFDPSIHLGRQGLGFRPSMVNEAEFEEIMKQTRAMPIPKWFLEPAQGTTVTRLRCCAQLLLLSNSLRPPVMSVAVSSSPLSGSWHWSQVLQCGCQQELFQKKTSVLGEIV